MTGLEPGARVIGVGYGAFAEYMVLPAAAVLPVPAGWADEQALGLVVNWPSALAALSPLGGIAAGQPSPALADLRSAYRRPEFVVPDTVTSYSPARTDVPAVVEVSAVARAAS